MARTTIPTDRTTLDACISDILFRNSTGQITPENHARLLGFVLDLLPTLLNNLPAGSRIQASALDGLSLMPGPEGRFDVPVYRVVSQGTTVTTAPTVSGFNYDENTHGLTLSGLTTGWVQTFPTFDSSTQDVFKSFAQFIPAANELSLFTSPFEIGAEGPAGRNGLSFNYRNKWQPTRNYVFMDVVYDRGSAWVCIVPHSSDNQNRPPEDENDPSTEWGLLLPRAERGEDGLGLEYVGEWSPGTTYTQNQWVTNPTDNLNYIARLSTHVADDTNAPPNTTYWVLMAPAGRDGRDGVDGIDGVDGDTGEQGEPGTPAPIPVELFRKRLKTEPIPTTVPTADFDPTPGIERLTNIVPSDWSEVFPAFNSATEQVDRSFSKYFFTDGGRLNPFSPPALSGQLGPPGINGQDGNKLLSGNGVPANTLGNNGDQYLDKDTGSLYEKASGTWTFSTSFQGPAGMTRFASSVLGTIRRKLIHSHNIDVNQERIAYSIGYRLPTDTRRDNVKVVFELDFASNPSVLYKYELATTWGDLRRPGGITHSFSTATRTTFGGSTSTLFINIRAQSAGNELVYISSIAGLDLKPIRIFEEEVETATLGSRWSIGSDYIAGQWVAYNNIAYECNVANRATALNAPDVDTTTWTPLFGSGGGVTSFINLTDTPTSYSGQSGRVPVVNSSEDGLVFENKTSGPQGRYDIKVFREVAHNPGGTDSTRPATPSATGWNPSTNTFTGLTTGWSNTFPSATNLTTHDIYESFTTYDPATMMLGAFAVPFEVGTEVGPTGPRGLQGIQGIQGIQGNPGTTTFDGLTDVPDLEAGNTTQFLRRDGTFAVPPGSMTSGGIRTWTGNTTYAENDIIRNDNILYRVNTAFTSGSTFSIYMNVATTTNARTGQRHQSAAFYRLDGSIVSPGIGEWAGLFPSQSVQVGDVITIGQTGKDNLQVITNRQVLGDGITSLTYTIQQGESALRINERKSGGPYPTLTITRTTRNIVLEIISKIRSGNLVTDFSLNNRFTLPADFNDTYDTLTIVFQKLTGPNAFGTLSFPCSFLISNSLGTFRLFDSDTGFYNSSTRTFTLSSGASSNRYFHAELT